MTFLFHNNDTFFCLCFIYYCLAYSEHVCVCMLNVFLLISIEIKFPPSNEKLTEVHKNLTSHFLINSKNDWKFEWIDLSRFLWKTYEFLCLPGMMKMDFFSIFRRYKWCYLVQKTISLKLLDIFRSYSNTQNYSFLY